MTALLSPAKITRAFLLPESAAVNVEASGALVTPDAIDTAVANWLRRLRLVQLDGASHGKAGFYPDHDFGSDADWCNGIGAEISALETELECDSGEVMDLYTDAHSAFYRDGTINPSDRPGQYGRETCYDFHFGAYADTAVSVWARSCEDALELAAEYVAAHYPGHIMPEGDSTLEDLRREACEERGLVYPPTCDHSELEEQGYYAAFESAEADLTYTESGYLTSYEWTVDEYDTPPCARK
jgi:hypothetical protein